MEFKVGDKVKIIAQEEGQDREGVIHQVADDGTYAVDFGEVLSFTHYCTLSGSPLPEGTGYWYEKEHMELIEKEVTMETQTVYKALIKVDGRLESVIAGYHTFKAHKTLEYVEGQIAYAPKDSMGIFVYDTIKGAKELLMQNASYTKRGLKVIYEATPLGTKMPKTQETFGWCLRYPTILLGKEVWRDKPIRPEPKFKVGDEVIVKESHTNIATPATGTIKTVEWSNHPCEEQHWHYRFLSWIADEDEVELAPPKEEWVDVTKECKAQLYHSTDKGCLITIKHNECPVFEIGNEGKAWRNSQYKVGTVEKGSPYTVNWFKILHKVV